MLKNSDQTDNQTQDYHLLFILGASCIGKSTTLDLLRQKYPHYSVLPLDKLAITYSETLIDKHYSHNKQLADNLKTILHRPVKHLSDLVDPASVEHIVTAQDINDFITLHNQNKKAFRHYASQYITEQAIQHNTVILDLVSYNDFSNIFSILEASAFNIHIDHVLLLLPFKAFLERVLMRNSQALKNKKYADIRVLNLPALQYLSLLDFSQSNNIPQSAVIDKTHFSNIEQVFDDIQRQQNTVFKHAIGSDEKLWETFNNEFKSAEITSKKIIKDFVYNIETQQLITKQPIKNYLNIYNKSAQEVANIVAAEYLC